jgi:excisionase family DNA binding protein
MADENDSGLRTLEDAGRYLGVSQRTLYRLASSGAIDIVKIGQRRSRIPVESLVRYVRRVKRIGAQNSKLKRA